MMTEPMDEPWPARPWWSALWGAASGVMVAMLTDHSAGLPTALRDAGPVFAFSLGVLGMLVMSRHGQRLWLSFALGAASLLAAVAASTVGYNHEHELFELPLLSAMLSAAIAVPVFKTWRDSAGCAMFRISAALLKLPSSATRTKYSSCLRFIRNGRRP